MSRAGAIAALDAAVEELARALASLDAPVATDAGWGPHEVLAHLVFWHETYARILRDMSDGRQPVLLEGVFREFNDRAVDRFRGVPDGVLIGRLRAAHSDVSNMLATLPAHARIRIKQHAKARGPVEFAGRIEGHFRGHLDELRHAAHRRTALAVEGVRP